MMSNHNQLYFQQCIP